MSIQEAIKKAEGQDREVAKTLRSSLHQVATEAIEAVRLERQIISGDFDAGYNSAIEDMEENAKKFLENL